MSDDLKLPPPADPTSTETPAVPTYAEVKARKQRPRRMVPIMVDDGLVEFIFEALPRPDFEKLRDDHPPMAAQRSEFKSKMRAQGFAAHQVGELGYNPDTFPPALIAACCVSPKLTLEDALEIWSGEDFSAGELGSLMNAAYAVNNVNALAPLGNV
jgi:hypothetical protein